MYKIVQQMLTRVGFYCYVCGTGLDGWDQVEVGIDGGAKDKEAAGHMIADLLNDAGYSAAVLVDDYVVFVRHLKAAKPGECEVEIDYTYNPF